MNTAKAENRTTPGKIERVKKFFDYISWGLFAVGFAFGIPWAAEAGLTDHGVLNPLYEESKRGIIKVKQKIENIFTYKKDTTLKSSAVAAN